MAEPEGSESDQAEILSIQRRLLELSAERSYLNAERTLSVWVRTALGAMVVGVALDRLSITQIGHHLSSSDTASVWIGAAWVGFGILIAVVAGVRYWFYAITYRRKHNPPAYHGPYMAPAFVLFAALFGVVLLVLLLETP